MSFRVPFFPLAFPLALAVLMAIALCGCGVKPDKLDAPLGAEAARFPRAYPAPEHPLDVAPKPQPQAKQETPPAPVKATATGSRTRHVFRP